MPRLRNRAQLAAAAPEVSPSPSPPLSRPPRRAAARRSEELTSITVDNVREPDSPEATITLKMPARGRPSKRGQGAVMDSRESYGSAASLRAPRSTRAKRSVVIDSETDDEDNADADGEADIEEEEDEDDEDAEGEDEEMEDLGDEDADGDEDDDADADADADGEDDVEMIASPAPPTRRQAATATANPASTPVAVAVKPTVKVTPAPPTPSVEEKEMRMAATSVATSDDEELSELPSGEEQDDEEDEDEDEDEGEDEMDMGEDDEEMDGEGETDEEAGLRTPDSRASTPDVTKMTKRQRGRLDQVIDDNFLQLPMEPQIKKHLTAEEHAMRRAEMARRRKNLSEKRNEEEKMDTINRLLKKQAPKRRGKISAAEIAAGADTPDPTASAEGGDEDAAPAPANPVFSRWVSRKEGNVLGLPVEWKDVNGVQTWAGSQHWRAPVAVEEVEG